MHVLQMLKIMNTRKYITSSVVCKVVVVVNFSHHICERQRCHVKIIRMSEQPRDTVKASVKITPDACRTDVGKKIIDFSELMDALEKKLSHSWY